MIGDPRVCGIIPAYNARVSVGNVVRGALRHLEAVFVADDGSGDGTAEAAVDAGAILIALGANRGKGNALRALFAEGRRRGFSVVIALDADGQHDAEDIPSFLRAHRAHPEAILTGSRMWDPVQIPQHRHNSMLVARFFISLAANQFIEDTQCGFRLYPLAAIESMALLKERYVTETEILMKAGDSGREIRTLPIRARYPPGLSTHFRSIRDIAAISRYVISYLMVKWGIEAVKPGVVNTYQGPGTGRDLFHRSAHVDLAFEYLTVLAALPLTLLYGLLHAAGRRLSVPAVQSLARGGIPVGRLMWTVMLLPVLPLLSLLDLIGNRLRIHPGLTTEFVRRWYATPSRRN